MGIGVTVFLVVLVLVLAAFVLFLGAQFYFSKRTSGRIEGVLLVEGRPATAGVPIICHLSSEGGSLFSATVGKLLGLCCRGIPQDDACTSIRTSIVMWNKRTTTGGDGRFAIEKIPKGVVGLGREHAHEERGLPWVPESHPPARGNFEIAVLVRPGATTSVVVGRGGCTVRGRLILPGEDARLPAEAMVREAILIANHEDYEIPGNVSDATRTDWYYSEARLEWTGSMSRCYHIFIPYDGSFIVHNVLEGRYRVVIELDVPGKENQSKLHPFADYTGVLEVNMVQNDRAFADIALGNLPMTVYTAPQPGDILPAIDELLGRAGNDEDWPNYSGKFLLVLVWHPVDDIWASYSKTLRRVYELYRGRPEIKFLVLTQDSQWVSVENWVTQLQCAAPLILIPKAQATAVSSAFGVRDSAFFLVGPDGRFVATEIPPREVHRTLENSLARA